MGNNSFGLCYSHFCGHSPQHLSTLHSRCLLRYSNCENTRKHTHMIEYIFHVIRFNPLKYAGITLPCHLVLAENQVGSLNNEDWEISQRYSELQQT